MASNIDPTQPPASNPTTAAMRANMAAAKSEIENLENKLSRYLSLRWTSPIPLPPDIGTRVPFSEVIKGDPTGIWALASPTKIVIPPGYNSARFSFQCEIAPSASTTAAFIEMVGRRGAAIWPGTLWDEKLLNTDTTTAVRGESALFAVIQGQQYEIELMITSTVTESTVFGNYSNGWAQIELLNT